MGADRRADARGRRLPRQLDRRLRLILKGISAEDDRDRVSSRGWALGYLGGGLLLGLNLALLQRAEPVELSTDSRSPYSTLVRVDVPRGIRDAGDVVPSAV